VYNAITEGRPTQLLDLLPWRQPYWQFQNIMELERELGVTSAFYFLNEKMLFHKPIHNWIRPEAWRLYLGRYDIHDPAITEVIRELDAGGWEVGLHGSYDSYRDPKRLEHEKRELEAIVGHSIIGCRQHYLNLTQPWTWQYQSDIGLRYDASLGHADAYGFRGQYKPIRPFGDRFVVFPLTLMETSLPDVDSEPERAWSECERLLTEAYENTAVMTVLWHPRYFNEQDYPWFGRLYRRLIRRAQALGAWIGSPGEYYRTMDHPPGARTEFRNGPRRTEVTNRREVDGN
jgi:hypothetical protein